MLLVIGIIAAVVVLSFTSKWWTEGLISGVEFIILTVIYGGLGFGLFALCSRKEIGGAVFVLIVIIASVGWALYCNHKLGIKQYYREKIKDYENMIRADPRNTAARSLLAEAYYMLGDIDQAIAAMELLIQISPNSMKERHTLRQWQVDRELRDSKIVVCRICCSKNVWGIQNCRVCLQPLVYPQAGKPSWADGIVKYGWQIAVGAAWMVVTIVAFSIMKPAFGAIVSICSAFSIVGMLLLPSTRK